MKNDVLRRLSRTELLTMLRDQELEISELKAENRRLKKQLEDRRIKIEESGSIAEASLKLTSIFVEAQKAIDLYRANCLVESASSAGSADGGTEREEDRIQEEV